MLDYIHVRPIPLFRDALGDRTLLRTVQEDLGIQGREQHLLVIQGLEQYNKVEIQCFDRE